VIESPAPESAANTQAPAYIFPLKGDVAPVQLMFLRRALKDAERVGASAFIIDMDTYGGRLDVTMDILELLRKTKLPTATFINPNAGSAGSLISLGTRKIYMRKDSVIGAAAVVSSEGADIEKSMKQKLDSFNTAKMRAVAEENGHNPDIAEAFMVTEKVLKVGDAEIDGKDTLLSLNGGEAVKLYAGKPLLAAGLAETMDEVLKLRGLGTNVIRMEPSGFENIALLLTKFSWLLLLGGIAGGYIEMKAPGFGIPGITSIICFALFFFGHYAAALTGWEPTIVFVIGAMLIVVELFFIPGTVFAGLAGAVLVFGAIVWAMVDHWPTQPGTLGAVDFERPILNLVIALGGAAVIAAIVAKILPHTSIYRKMVLVGAPEGSPKSHETWDITVKVGETGVASTTLRPAGKAVFGDSVVDVVSDGTFIEAGAGIRVTLVEGGRVVVVPVA
jgi:membrane-bound serine protease (ClpP class)